MRARLALVAGVLVVGVAACNDQSHPTSPSAAPVTVAPGDVISDGANGGGNPDFFFLPPLQPSPRNNSHFDRGKFNPNLSPTVKICDGRDVTPASECLHPLLRKGVPAVFTAVRGWDGLPDWVDPEQYHVLWQTKDYSLVADGKHAYRILIKVGSTLLGFLDVVPTNGLVGALRVTAGGQDIGWLDDWVVPIRFRIERGALSTECTDPASCSEATVIGAAPGTPGDTTKAIVVPSGYAALSLPKSAVKQGDTVTIVIEKEAPLYSGGTECLPTDILQANGCWHFSSDPAGYHFATPVRLEACVDVQTLPPEDQDNAWRLFKYNTTEGLTELPWAAPQLINCSSFIATVNPAPAPPANVAAAALNRLGTWLGRVFGPPPLYAYRFAGVPKGGGGTGGSFSDVGAAVPGSATQAPDTVRVPTGGTVGQTGLVATATGGSGTGAFSFTSLTPMVCTVDATSGSLTLLAAGTCSLTATKAADDVYSARTSDPQSFTVNSGAVASVTVSPAGAALNGVGATQTFTAVAKDSHGNVIGGKTFTWASLNPDVATVNPTSGVATAVAAGQATVSASADGVTGYGLVTVATPGVAPVNLWVQRPSGTAADLNGVWGASASNVFAVGSSGTVLHYNGTSWSAMPSVPTSVILYGVWGTSASDVFAVGQMRTILHYDGTAWTSQMSDPNNPGVMAVWGTAPNDVWAFGILGEVLHYNGSSWSEVTVAPSGLFGSIGFSRSNVFAGGGGGTVLHYDGAAWGPVNTGMAANEGLYGLWGTSGTSLFAVSGSTANIYHYNGATWTLQASMAGGTPRAVWGSADNDVYSVGVLGNTYRYDGSVWAAQGRATNGQLQALWGAGSGQVFAVGLSGTFVAGYRGAAVTVTPSNPEVGAGAAQALTAVARDASLNQISGVNFTWTSSNPAVATVDASGTVTGVAAGSATITATAPGGASGSATVTVPLLPTDVTTPLAFDGWLVLNGGIAQHIYRLDPGSASWIDITPTSADTNSSPAWFSNGQMLAFADGFDIYKMNSDGTGRMQLTTLGDAAYPAVSPLNGAIAFVRGLAGAQDIWVMNSNGSGLTNITNCPAIHYFGPAWSPDGTKIAFSAGGATCYPSAGDAYVMNADGSGLLRITTNGSSGYEEMESPAWSPSGNRIALAHRYEKHQVISLVDPDGSNLVDITHEPDFTFDSDPMWSSNGNWIAFVQGGSIYAVHADGSGQRLVVNGSVNPGYGYSHPAWPLP